MPNTVCTVIEAETMKEGRRTDVLFQRIGNAGRDKSATGQALRQLRLTLSYTFVGRSFKASALVCCLLLRSPIPVARGQLYSLLWRLDQPCLDKGRTHAVIMSVHMPARTRVDQVLKERYLFVLGHLALFVSDKLVHQSQNPPPSFG